MFTLRPTADRTDWDSGNKKRRGCQISRTFRTFREFLDDDPGLDSIILTLVDTGIRALELCNLRIGQVDLKNQWVKVLGKGKKERMLPMSARTVQRLWRYRATREER